MTRTILVRASTLLLLALPAAAETRLYHNETIAGLHRSRHTHVRVTGTVTYVKHEADGDLHFRLEDAAGRFVVCEIVPYRTLPAPRRGQVVTVEGIHRYDNEAGHGWDELHPVEQWRENR